MALYSTRCTHFPYTTLFRSKTLLVSLHDMDLVSDLFDRVLALKDGAWFWEGRPAELNRPSQNHAPSFSASTRSKRRSEEHTSELQSRLHLVCRLLLEKKNKT